MAQSTPNNQTLDGKTSIDDKMFFEPERLSYRAATRLAAEVRLAIGDTVRDRAVIVAGTALLVDLFNLRAVSASLGRLEEDYRALSAVQEHTGAPIEELATDVTGSAVLAAAGTAVTSAIPVITGALGILSFFREDVEYRGIRTVVDPLAFELALAGELKSLGKAKDVFVVDLFVPSSKASVLSHQFASVHSARALAWQKAGPQIAEMARLDAELDRAARNDNQKLVDTLAGRIATLRRDLEPLTQPLSKIDKQLDDLESSLNRADENTRLTAMARLLRAEALVSAAPDVYLVHAAIVSSGGHHRISRNLFRMLFLGDGLSFLGGAVVRWAVVDASGAVQLAGVKDLSLTGRFRLPELDLTDFKID